MKCTEVDLSKEGETETLQVKCSIIQLCPKIHITYFSQVYKILWVIFQSEIFFLQMSQKCFESKCLKRRNVHGFVFCLQTLVFLRQQWKKEDEMTRKRHLHNNKVQKNLDRKKLHTNLYLSFFRESAKSQYYRHPELDNVSKVYHFLYCRLLTFPQNKRV